jgi:hypothetical protein
VPAVTATPARLALLDTVTVVATFYNGGAVAGPYVATLMKRGSLIRGRATPFGQSATGRHGKKLYIPWYGSL